jgi:hypothetical protein
VKLADPKIALIHDLLSGGMLGLSAGEHLPQDLDLLPQALDVLLGLFVPGAVVHEARRTRNGTQV